MSRWSTVWADATFVPAPVPIAVAAPTAFARAMVAGMSYPLIYPRTIAAAKLSPQPTVSPTGTYMNFYGHVGALTSRVKHKRADGVHVLLVKHFLKVIFAVFHFTSDATEVFSFF